MVELSSNRMDAAGKLHYRESHLLSGVHFSHIFAVTYPSIAAHSLNNSWKHHSVSMSDSSKRPLIEICRRSKDLTSDENSFPSRSTFHRIIIFSAHARWKKISDVKLTASHMWTSTGYELVMPRKTRAKHSHSMFFTVGVSSIYFVHFFYSVSFCFPSMRPKLRSLPKKPAICGRVPGGSSGGTRS